MLRNTLQTWGWPHRLLHWVMAVLVICMITLGVYISFLDRNDPVEAPIKAGLGSLHKATGILLLVLVTLRAAWALLNVKPALPPTVPLWQRRAAKASHITLYILLFCMPISGYLMSSYAQSPVDFYGLLEIPALFSERNIDMAMRIRKVHETLAMLLSVLIAVHICAALKHHFVDRDNVLRRMLTGQS
jgi:cytochrome b561